MRDDIDVVNELPAEAYLELVEDVVTVDVLLGIAALAGYDGQAVHLHDSFNLKP